MRTETDHLCLERALETLRHYASKDTISSGDVNHQLYHAPLPNKIKTRTADPSALDKLVPKDRLQHRGPGHLKKRMPPLEAHGQKYS